MDGSSSHHPDAHKPTKPHHDPDVVGAPFDAPHDAPSDGAPPAPANPHHNADSRPDANPDNEMFLYPRGRQL